MEPTATERVKVSLLTDRSGCLLRHGKDPRSQMGGCCRVSVRESHRVEETRGLTLSSCKKQDGKLTFEFPESWGGMSGRSQQVSLSGSKIHNLGLQVGIRLFLLSIHSLKKDFPQQRNTLSAQNRLPSWTFYILSLKVKPSFTIHGPVGVKNKVCNVDDISWDFICLLSHLFPTDTYMFLHQPAK